MNPVLMKPQTVKLYIPRINEISVEFVAKIKRSLDENYFVPNNFYYMISQWSLESIGYIALNRRLNVLDDDSKDERTKQIIKVIILFNIHAKFSI